MSKRFVIRFFQRMVNGLLRRRASASSECEICGWNDLKPESNYESVLECQCCWHLQSKKGSEDDVKSDISVNSSISGL